MATISKAEIERGVVEQLHSALDRLYNIWHKIGILEPQMRERANTVSLHLCNLLEEMVKEEEEMERQILHNIDKLRLQIDNLSRDLSLPPFRATEGLSLLLREKELRSKHDTLAREKADRLRQLGQLKEKDMHLCEVLCATPYYIPTGTTPSREQLAELERHVVALSAEKEKRYTDFVVKKKQVISLFTEIDRNPDTSFERDIVCEEDDSFLLSKDNMQSLTSLVKELEQQRWEMQRTTQELWEKVRGLWDRLELDEAEREAFCQGKSGFKPAVIATLRAEVARCEQLKTQHIRRFVEGARRDLVALWDKCYFSKAQREAFTPMQETAVFTEDLLRQHELEVERVQQYYRQNQVLLEKVTKRQELFNQMIALEKKAADPRRYNNRGGALLQEEKTRKKIIKDLPKVEEEVKEAIARWETEQGQKFLLEEVPFAKFVENQWAEYQEEKEREKEQRHQARAKQMEEEMIYGSKPTTPAKRRFAGTPSKTPNKSRRLNNMSSVRGSVKFNETKTPSSTPRGQTKNSTFVSPMRRPPLSASRVNSAKSSQGRVMQRRRSLRQQARRALNQNKGTPVSATGPGNDLFSHTTVTSSDSNQGNSTLASTGSYQDFANGLNPTSRPNCRSSHMPGSVRI